MKQKSAGGVSIARGKNRVVRLAHISHLLGGFSNRLKFAERLPQRGRGSTDVGLPF